MLRPFTPHLCVTTVINIPLAELARQGIKGLLLDLDNTLLERRAEGFDPAIVRWVESTKAQGFALCLVTNAPPARTVRMAALLKIPGIPRAQKPLTGGLRRGLALMALRPEQVAMVGDQIFTDVWAGNRLGTYTILVRPISQHESILTRVKRPLERLLLARMRHAVPGLAQALAAEAKLRRAPVAEVRTTSHGADGGD